MSDIQKELPKYRCHKEVWGLKIAGVEIHQDGSATIAPERADYAPFKTPPGWGERFKGSEEDLGYWVLYKGGYQSWSPSQEFEDGYTEI